MKTKLFLLLVVLFTMLSVFNVLYNSIYSVLEIKNWLPKTDKQKREMIYGSLYSFFTLIDNNTPLKSNILIFSKDVRTFSLGNYYLYPKVVFVTANRQEFKQLSEEGKFKFIAVFNEKISIQNYKLLASEKYGEVFELK